MENLAIIGGSGLSEYKRAGVVFLQRHKGNTPPHKINYKKNINSLKNKGIKKIIAVNSVGSLKKEIKPGSLITPDDFISLMNVPTFFNKEIRHIVPAIDDKLRELIISAALKLDIDIIKKGTYFQATGPRFETKAEIKMISNYADIVGMTMGSEATLAMELGINYATICTVDNYANGVTEKELNIKEWKYEQKKTKENVIKLLDNIIKQK